MAVNLFSEIFKVEKAEGIFRNGEYNLYRRSSKGSVEVKKALDAAKVSVLKEFVINHIPHGSDKATVWSDCVDAIHKKITTWKSI